MESRSDPVNRCMKSLHQIMEACLSEATEAERIAALEREIDRLKSYSKDLENDLARLSALKDVERAITGKAGADPYTELFGPEASSPVNRQRDIFNLLYRYMDKPIPMDRIVSYVYANADTDRIKDPRRTVSVMLSILRKKLKGKGFEIKKGGKSTYYLTRTEDA